jgi:hypothetical protein
VRYYTEIEFVCANSQFPHWKTILDKHEALLQMLEGVPGVLPYRQDFSDEEHTEISMAVILLDPRMKKVVLDAADAVELPVDIAQRKAERLVDEVLKGTYPNMLG